MIQINDFSIGDPVLVCGEPRFISLITKKKIGYHRERGETKMWYARLNEVEPIPLSEKIVYEFNKTAGIHMFIYWDDRFPADKRKYLLIVKGVEFKVNYVHQVVKIAKVFDLKHCMLDIVGYGKEK